MKTPLVMGIINVTPDSFSGDGLLPVAVAVAGSLPRVGARGRLPAEQWHQNYYADAVDLAVAKAERMIRDGADILDVGGESSRPGSAPVPTEEEILRVVPVIAALKKKFGTTPLAVDTVKAEVAEQALQAGASIVNDISALGDARMGEIMVRYDAQVVLMHNRAKAASVNHDAKIGGQYEAPPYKDVVSDVARELKARVSVALKAGIARDKIILDPGIGFGKTPEQNLALIAQVGIIKALGFPVLVGPSRKSFIGRVLDIAVDERLEGTAACVAVAVMEGADIVRVHDVKFMARVVKMVAALKEATKA